MPKIQTSGSFEKYDKYGTFLDTQLFENYILQIKSRLIYRMNAGEKGDVEWEMGNF